MHGVRRGSRLKGAAAEEARKQEQRDAELSRRALKVRNSDAEDRFSAENDALVARALERNGEEYSLWNYRRELLLELHRKWKEEKLINDEKADVVSTAHGRLVKKWKEELALTERALRWMPKSYGTWAYRLFLLESEGVDRELREKALKPEQIMIERMLKADPRNFLGWAHRMRIRRLAKGPSENKVEYAEQEMKFAEGKILENFANYSAWHVRSRFFLDVRKDKNMAEVLSDEFNLLREAFYTEPEVQSTWFYHRWLIETTENQYGVSGRERWENELEMCDSLLDLEPDAKYALQTKAFLLTKLCRNDEAEEVYSKLVELDPMRRGYYKYNIEQLKQTDESTIDK